MSDGPSVLYLIDSLAAGGAERSLLEMAPHLLGEGIRLRVAVLYDRPGLGPEMEAAGVPVTVVGGTSRLGKAARAVTLLRHRRPDLLHTTLFESDVIGRSAAAFVGVPVVSSLVSTPYGAEHRAEAGVGRLKLGGAQFLDAVTARAAVRLHAVSASTASTYVARLHLTPDRVEVIPRGRDLRRLGRRSPARRREIRAALGLSDDACMVLALSRHEPQKGLDVLVQATPVIVARRPAAIVLVAGAEGRATEALRRQVALLGVGAAVRFLGRRDDVADLLAAADVFVLPSRREGLPGAVLEAMAMQVPIVASDLPAVREAVPDGRHAVLVPAEDPARLAGAVLSVGESPLDAAARVDASRRRFEERFDIATVSHAMASFYRGALGEAGR